MAADQHTAAAGDGTQLAERMAPGPARQALIDELVAQGVSFAEVGEDPRVGVSKQRVAQITTATPPPRRGDQRRDLKVHPDVSQRVTELRRQMDDALPSDHKRKLDATGRRMGVTVNAAVVAVLDVLDGVTAIRDECPRVDEILKEVGL